MKPERILYELSFKIPLTPPSVNSLYQVFRYGKKLEVKLHPHVLIFKNEVKGFIPRWEWKHQGELLFFEMDFHDTSYFFKNGKLRKFDITNTEKALLDAVCEKIGVDDCFVKERMLRHKPSLLKTYMDVRIGILKPANLIEETRKP